MAPVSSTVEFQPVAAEEQLSYQVGYSNAHRPEGVMLDPDTGHKTPSRFGIEEFKLESPRCDKLRAYCTSEGYSLEALLLAAFRAAQYRCTGASDVTIGVLSLVQSRSGKVGGATEPNVALRPIRTRIEDSTSFLDLLHQARNDLDDADGKASSQPTGEPTLPQSTASCSHGKTFFSLRDRSASKYDRHASDVYPPEYVAEAELILQIWSTEERLYGNFQFAIGAFDRDSIISLESVFREILVNGMNDPTTLVSELPLLADLTRVSQGTDGEDSIHHSSVYDTFCAQVLENPNSIAVKDMSQELTYSELNHFSRKVSSWLALRQYPAETMVGVLAGRSVAAIIMYIGILGANHAYVPLDIKSPAERLNHMLSSLGNHSLVLYGPGLESLATQLADAEYVSLAHILSDSVSAMPMEHMLPLPTSLAAVIFTSGSTGRPKGVMIEHRAVVRVAKQESYQIPKHSPRERTVVAHLLNPAFDAAMMEIYSALLNGHSIYCVDESTLLDSHALSETFAQECVRMAVFTPALLDHCLREAPVLFKGLRVLVVGGDRFKSPHARQLKQLVQGEVFNGYGPTENTVVSTLYRIPTEHEHMSNDVPIGRAVTGSFAVVVDPQQRLVPPGVVGELVVGGDGLARGYLDPKLNVGRFVHLCIKGKTVRAYRTGDLARLRPKDLQLQFLGRMDHQVKIRGHRIEVNEIDQVLMAHSAIDSAATIAYFTDSTQEADLVSFVTKSGGSRYADLGLDLATSNLGNDFVGWTSMYDGIALPRNAMQEWLDDTIRTIRESCPSGELGKVLELGAGSGMMLFNLAPLSKEYVGVEPSLVAVDFVNHAVESIPDLKAKARAYQGSADAVGRWMDDCQPDVVVINSVSMYFPSAEYVYKIVEDAIGQLRPRQQTRIFFGDVRSYALYHEFLAHKSIHNAVEVLTLRDVRDMVDEQVAREGELLIDPAFFTKLTVKFGDNIDHVEILPKRMHTTNELSCFRYAAVIHLRGTEARPLNVQAIDAQDWIDVVGCGFDRATIEKRLIDIHPSSSSSEIVLALSNIPCSKIAADVSIVDAIRASGTQQLDEDVAKLSGQIANNDLSWDAAELHQLAQAAGLEVEVSWARQYSQRGGMDAVFYRHRKEARKLFRFPVDHADHEPRTFCNEPLQVDDRAALQEETEAWARDKLPPYMMPKAVLVIDQMPLTNNGKVDYKALAQIASTELAAASKRNSVRTSRGRSCDSAVEAKLKDMWATVLNIPAASISADDHFVHKGGDSLKAMRLKAEARRHGLTLSIPDILTSPRLCDMAALISEGMDADQVVCKEPAHDDVGPFELLQHTPETEARNSAATQCDLPANSIKDVFPCTPLQAALAALNLANPTDYVARHVKELLPNTDVGRLQRAFADVVRAHPILRTRIIYLPGDNFVQAVTDDAVAWKSGDSVEEYVKEDRQNFMGLGKPLLRAAVIMEEARRFFILTMHHSLCDGWSMRILLNSLDRAYQSLSISDPPPFQSFIKALVKHNQSDAGKQAWKANLMGYEAEPFPRLPYSDYRPKPDSIQRCHVEKLSFEHMDVTAAVAIRAALAILVSQRENVDDIVFGTTLSGRDSITVPGIQEMTGPTITTVPTRATFPYPEETVGDLLVRLQREWVTLSKYEHMGLAAIRDLSEDALRATKFQALLVVQPAEDSRHASADNFSLFKAEVSERAADKDMGVSTYAMMMECQLFTGGVTIQATFDSTVVPEAQTKQILSQYEAILRKLCQSEVRERRLSEVEWLCEADWSAISTWNRAVPDAVELPVHELLSSTFRRRSGAQAVRAWDGNLTYEEHDSLSTRLAYHMLDLADVASATVGIYVGKSKWTSVTMLAVMKAGATYCLLDSSLPSARLQSMVDQLGPRIILVSPEQEASAKTLFGGQLVVVDMAHATHWLGPRPEQRLPHVDPTTPLYIVFTSGSTGAPKGVVISHRNYSSALVHQYPRRSVGQDSGVYDFSGLAFDMMIINNLHTLYAGGCVCVPSETDRQDDMSGSILRLGATFACLTPTLASTLDITALQALDSLEVGGEAADEGEMQKIRAYTALRPVYGPSECTPFTSMAEHGAHALSIGRPAGALSWLVHPQHTNQLVGIGCVAELWLEGPVVGPGYYNDPERTAAAYIENPTWMTRDRPGRPGRKGRAYRTGDLVRYEADGSLVFVGRSNTQQIKIRGQRVELLDVQHNVQDVLRKSLPDVSVIAEVAGAKKDTLVAFIHVPTKSYATSSFDARCSLLQDKAGNVKSVLAGILSTYMIPSLFIPMESFPMTPSGKLDRRRLLAIVEELTQEQREACSMHPGRKQSAAAQPQTHMEDRLRSLWATTLGVDAESITAEDNFFHRGGDSLLAIRLVNAARRAGIPFSVKDVWNWPQLGSLASHLEVAPLTTPTSDSTSKKETSPRRQRSITSSEVLPLSWSQHQFLDGTVNGYSDHVYHMLCNIPSDCSTENVKDACQSLLQQFDVLRVRFVCSAQRVHQIFDDEGRSQLSWQEIHVTDGDIEDAVYQFCESDRATLGLRPHPETPITRFVLIHSQQGPRKLVMRLSHAQYDGVSVPRMFATLSGLVTQSTAPAPVRPFADYLRHIFAHNSESYAYWRKLLKGSTAPTIIQPTRQTAPAGVRLLRASKTIPQPATPENTAQTPAIRFLASCAAMLAEITSSRDVVFGCIVSGRSGVPQDLQDVCGPCLNEVPVRVTFPDTTDKATAESAFDLVRGQMLESSAHDTVGFDEIAAHCTSWGEELDDFGLTAHYQNSADLGELLRDGAEVDFVQHQGDMAIPKANYVEVEAIPLPNERVRISVMAKSSCYDEAFLEDLLRIVCTNYST